MIPRIFEQHLLQVLREFPVVALVGPRQVGKSTLALSESVGRDRRYVSMDDIAHRSFAERDAVGVVQSASPLTIDEVQLVPDLLRAIKVEVDTDRAPGRFLITGSADLNYAVDLSQVLAGRVGIVSLPPITQLELHCAEQSVPPGRPGWAELITTGVPQSTSRNAGAFRWEHLLVGGFPLSVRAGSDEARLRWLDSFPATYLERDLRRLSDIAHLTEFARLMELTAGRTSGVVNQAALGREAGLNAMTVGRYLSLLEAGQLIHRLRPWFANIGKRLVKSPKLHWRDVGLAAFLAGLRSTDLPEDPLVGPLFESMVVEEIVSLLPVFLPAAQGFYVRSHDGLEVDLVIKHGRRMYPFEVKASRTVSAGDAGALETWLTLADQPGPGAVIYAGTEVKQLSRNVFALPFPGG